MRLQNLRLALPALGVVVIAVACTLTQVGPPSDANETCVSLLNPANHNPLSTAEFNGWFESGAVSLNGAVKPANSVLFPDDPNCTFYKWSEQMFLWLTSPAPPRYGGAGGLVMNSPVFFDVSLPDANGQRHFEPHTPGLIRAFNMRTAQRGFLGLPVVLEAKTLRILELIPPVLGPSGRQLVADAEGNEIEVFDLRIEPGRQPVLLDRSGQPIKSPRRVVALEKGTGSSPLRT
jgi:hypothetical protein